MELGILGVIFSIGSGEVERSLVHTVGPVYLGPVVQEEGDGVGVPAPGGEVYGTLSLVVGGVDESLALGVGEEHGHGLTVPRLHGQGQRGVPVAVLLMDGGLLLLGLQVVKHQPDDLAGALLSRPVERALPLFVLDPTAGPALQQQPADPLVLVGGGDVESGAALLVPAVFVDVVQAEEVVDHLGVAPHGRVVEWGEAVVVLPVVVGPGLHQQPHHGQPRVRLLAVILRLAASRDVLTVASRVVERSHPVRPNIVHPHLVLRGEEGLHHGQVAVAAGVVQGGAKLGVQPVQGAGGEVGRQEVVLQLLQVTIPGYL